MQARDCIVRPGNVACLKASDTQNDENEKFLLKLLTTVNLFSLKNSNNISCYLCVAFISNWKKE